MSDLGLELAQWRRPVVIAEIGSNHDRSLSKAHDLIDMSADAGADAVKFQLFRAVDLYPRNVGTVELPGGPRDFHQVLLDNELPPSWLPELTGRARSRGLRFLATPFSVDAVEALVAAGVDAIKIASPEITYLGLIEAAAGTGRPLVISTGMASLSDIDLAVRTAEDAGAASIALLHCVTAYPTPLHETNARVVESLAAMFGHPSGLSDHSTDPLPAPLAATVAGACVVEKHVTLSRTSPGPDHAFALEPRDFAAMCDAVHAIGELPSEERLGAATDMVGASALTAALGRATKRLAPSEAELAACDQRTIRASHTLPAGHRITVSDVEILRGERNLRPGLHPRHLPLVLGSVLVESVPYGEGIRWIDLIDHRPAPDL